MCASSQAELPAFSTLAAVTAPRESKPQVEQIETLLKRWRASLDLHQRYSAMDDESYQQIQPWPKHERPAAWILKLAQDKLGALERIVKQRTQDKDRGFVEALELISFLANLVGLQNTDRFVPLVDAGTERRAKADDATRQMPALQPGKLGRLLLEQRTGVPYKSRSGKSSSTQKVAAEKPAAVKVAAKTTAAKPAPKSVEALVVDDVLRLIGWGRATHELADLIASLSGRPNASGVRRIIREYRQHIERQLGTR